jgi:cytochrome c oxidase assembly protein subunit 11
MQQSARRNLNVVMILVGVLAGMTGLTFAAVPLYRLFCAHTGFDGTPIRGDAASVPAQTINRFVTVSFSGDTNVDIPWKFYPKQRSVTVRVGEPTLAYFIAENEAKQTVTGTATFNVSPEPWGPYFVKIQCFCFTKQTLKPGERVEMPVTFYIDPAMAKDRLLDQMSDVTLSYTFFKAADQTPDATVGIAETPAQPTKLN